MRSYVFTVVLVQRPNEAALNKFAQAGSYDATFGAERGVAVVEFDRQAASFAEAIASAVRDLQDADMVAVRVLDEDLVTLADIADLIGQSRESVRRYATGARRRGGFPPPANPARDGTVFYRWSEVAPWVRKHLRIDLSDVDPALVVANHVLQARQSIDQVEHASALTGLLRAGERGSSMSTWIHLDGRIKGGTTPLDTTGPCGSEGCAKLAQLGDDSWYIANGDLRDRDVNDVPSIRDWFARVCEAVAPDEASIEINVDTSCYHYTWTGQRLELYVPQLHRAEVVEEIVRMLTRRSDEAAKRKPTPRTR